MGELIPLVALVVTIGGVVWGFVKWLLTRREDRYQKGVEKLGSGELYVRLAGVDELQRLAKDHPKQYHVHVMSRLCDFVRNPTKDEDERTGSGGSVKDRVKVLMVPEDVQAAIEAIGTRSVAGGKLEKKKGFKPDLSGAKLRGVDLSKRKANLSGFDLTHAVFAPPNLLPLDLSIRETLVLPRITAILLDADLRGAKLFEADLTDADLTGADLRGAEGLTQDQLDTARADPANPPNLDGLRDSWTDKPLRCCGNRPPLRSVRDQLSGE